MRDDAFWHCKTVVNDLLDVEITSHAVNTCLVQLSGTTETNGTEENPQTPTTVAGENNASQRKANTLERPHEYVEMKHRPQLI